MLGGLKTVLEKAKTDVEAGKLDETKLLNDSLAPDMFSFTKQVQIACDNAKGVVGRLTSIEAPIHEDNEMSLNELIARIEKTVDFLKTADEAAFEGAGEKKVEIKYFPGKFMTGFDYAREYVIPNFFFHLTVAYALVRKNDTAIGKADFMNGLSLQDM